MKVKFTPTKQNWWKLYLHRSEIWLEVMITSPFKYVGLAECSRHFTTTLFIFGLEFQWSSE